MGIRNYCPPQADFFYIGRSGNAFFALKNNVFDCIRVLKSLKISGLRPDQIPIFDFSGTYEINFFSQVLIISEPPPIGHQRL